MVWLLVATRLEFGPNYLVNYLGGCCSGGGAGHNNDGDSRPGLRAGGRGLEQNEGFRIVSTKEQTRTAVRQRTQIPAARLCQR